MTLSISLKCLCANAQCGHNQEELDVFVHGMHGALPKHGYEAKTDFMG